MGYVPQDDIVHPQLTVRQALYFSARLRTDLNDSEIDARTEKVLHDLGIPDKIDTVIGSPERKTLSGGQRKRVNIALELITDTPLLFLDEPTSGLSSYDAESVVDLLKDLSKTGKTIITTIHQPSLKVYKQFDDLLMVSRDRGDSPGALVFFGPAFPDSIQFFNSPASAPSPFNTQSDLNPEMLFSGMNRVPEANRTQTWRKRFQASRYQQEFVAGRSGKQPAAGGKTGEETPRRQFSLVQWFALVRRNVIVKMQDRAQTAILLLQAPLFALLVALINYPLQADRFDELVQKLPIIHFLMVVAAIWFGCNNAARDIVGEWTIYKRERMVTLKLIPYVFSKLAVLLGLCIFQCGSLLAIVYLACGLHSNFLEDFLVLLVASMIGAGLGLCISALSKTNESAIALLPVVLLPIIALGGGMRPIYLMPTRRALRQPSACSKHATSRTPAARCGLPRQRRFRPLRRRCGELHSALPHHLHRRQGEGADLPGFSESVLSAGQPHGLCLPIPSPIPRLDGSPGLHAVSLGRRGPGDSAQA